MSRQYPDDPDLPRPRSRTPAPVLIPPPMAVEPAADVSVTRLHVPLPIALAALACLISLCISMAFVWFRVAAHLETHETHLDVRELTQGGGLAYKMDVLGLRTDLEKRTRKLLKAMTLHCDQSSNGFTCRVDLPEE